MADRFPLIANTSANQIQEIGSGDNLDLTGNNIIGVSNVDATNISVTGLSTFSGNVYIPNISGVSTFSSNVNLDSNLIVTGVSNLTHLSVSGITTLASLTFASVGNDTELTEDGGSIIINSAELHHSGSKKLETTNSGVTVTGGVTAGSFTGNGSGLTNVVSMGTGVLVKDDGVNVGAAATLDFGGNIYVTPVSAGIVTITSGGVDSGYFHKNNTGIHTLSSVGIGLTNPTVPLEVQGNIKSSATISAQDFNTTSDQSLKENILDIEGAVDKLCEIRGVSFDWVGREESSMGVIAQEVENVFPDLVSITEPKQVNYNGLIGVLIQAVKELKGENELLRAQIHDIMNTINS
tara:strand:- start:654 stop:1703 length:1050 start_codon:yes stop_codon:yes gene_type:complete